MSYDVGDCEAYDVYSSTVRQARKDHRCGACHLAINPGDRYVAIRAVWDGTAETIKRCGRCETVFQHLLTLGRGDFYPDERLNCGMDYEYEWDQKPPESIQAVIFATADEASALLEAS